MLGEGQGPLVQDPDPRGHGTPHLHVPHGDDAPTRGDGAGLPSTPTPDALHYQRQLGTYATKVVANLRSWVGAGGMSNVNGKVYELGLGSSSKIHLPRNPEGILSITGEPRERARIRARGLALPAPGSLHRQWQGCCGRCPRSWRVRRRLWRRPPHSTREGGSWSGRSMRTVLPPSPSTAPAHRCSEDMHTLLVGCDHNCTCTIESSCK